MNDTKHTPTPYRIEPFLDGADDGSSVDEGFSLMADGMEEPIAIIGRATYRHHARYRDTSLEIDTANANFICLACNCHDDLLAACERALNFVRNTEDEHGMPLETGDILRAAIAKAEDAK